MNAIEDRVFKVISEELNIPKAEIDLSVSFEQDLGMNDLDFSNLAIAFDFEFNIPMPFEDVLKFGTVEDALDYISKRVKQ